MKKLMYIIITIGVFLIPLIAIITYSPPVPASGNHCHHHCDEPDPEPTPDPGPVVVHKKKVIVSVPALLLGVGGGICIYKRFWLDDPCIGKPAYKTSPADDKIVPENTSDKPIGVRLF